jgi:hypothetical protein
MFEPRRPSNDRLSLGLVQMFEMDQAKYDAACPPQFQSSEYLLSKGQVQATAFDLSHPYPVAHVFPLLAAPHALPIVRSALSGRVATG